MPFLAPSQGLLPARAGSPLAGRVSHPLDDAQSFMKVSPPPIPFDQPCLVALFYLSVRRPLRSIREVALAIGRLGGHLNRTRDGLPGWQTLWHGMNTLHALV